MNRTRLQSIHFGAKGDLLITERLDLRGAEHEAVVRGEGHDVVLVALEDVRAGAHGLIVLGLHVLHELGGAGHNTVLVEFAGKAFRVVMEGSNGDADLVDGNGVNCVDNDLDVFTLNAILAYFLAGGDAGDEL